ncbi:MAG: hypothetical protein ACI9I0_000224 [Rhodoferax sp.]|jgi:hypothetical protein
MKDRINEILAQMAALREKLRSIMYAQKSRMFFQIKGKHITFEPTVKTAHHQRKNNFFRWLIKSRTQNLITRPISYSIVLPLMLLDLCVSFYQWSCLPIYGITKVRRSDYIVIDRHHLEFLNFIEKFHCTHSNIATD